MWWGAVQSDALLANGLPNIPFGPSSSTPKKRKKVKASSNAEGKASKSRTIVKKESEDSPMPTAPFNPKALLHLMNNNIRTIRRVRHTHSKFLALNAATAPGEDDEGQPEAGPSFSGYGPSGSKPTLGYSGSAAYLVDAGLEDEMVDDKIDEVPWVFANNVGKGKGKERHVSGIDIGEKNASDCLHWAGAKILEHTGFQGTFVPLVECFLLLKIFQGTSKGALDVFADVTAEYFQNVGRTIKYLTDKFGSTMTPEVSVVASRKWPIADLTRKSFCTHYLRADRPRSQILNDLYRMILNDMVTALESLRRSLSMRTEKRSVTYTLVITATHRILDVWGRCRG